MLRTIFLLVFIISSIVTAMMFVNLNGAQQPALTPTKDSSIPNVSPTQSLTVPTEPANAPTLQVNLGVVAGTIFTSVTSLVGFITTTLISWRKEKRESVLADVERKKLETELEKSRLELANLKKASLKKKMKK